MSGPWVCERSDGLGLYVYDSTDIGEDPSRPEGHETELEAWEYALDVQLANRDELAASIKECRREVRRLIRRKHQ